MNQTLVRIYLLIMLECRLSFSEAASIFKVDPRELENAIRYSSFFINYEYALHFLKHETSCCIEGSERNRFKAMFYLRKLNRITKLESREEKVAAFNALLKDLSGPDISFVYEKKGRYTEEEKELILKYRVKYAVPINIMASRFSILKNSIINWTNDLPEGPLKTQLKLLNEFGEDNYSRIRKKFPNQKRNRG